MILFVDESTITISNSMAIFNAWISNTNNETITYQYHYQSKLSARTKTTINYTISRCRMDTPAHSKFDATPCKHQCVRFHLMQSGCIQLHQIKFCMELADKLVSASSCTKPVVLFNHPREEQYNFCRAQYLPAPTINDRNVLKTLRN